MDVIDSYKVYVKTNDQNSIISVNSSAFLADAEGWTLIDEGTGDRFHHAQGNYLDKPLMDDAGRWNYRLMDGKAVERTDEDKALDPVAEVFDADAALASDIMAAKTLDELKEALVGKNGLAKVKGERK